MVAREHLHVLLDAEQRILNCPLLDQREEHCADIGLPRDFVMFLEHLQSEKFTFLAVPCHHDGFDEAEELGVDLAQGKFSRQVVTQLAEQFVSWQH